MQQTSVLIQAAEGGHDIVNELPMDPIWYGLLVFALLMAALAATMSMRSRALRLPEPTTAVQHHGTGRGSHTSGH